MGFGGFGVWFLGGKELEFRNADLKIAKPLRTIYDPPAKARIMKVGHLVVAARSLYGPSIEPGH